MANTLPIIGTNNLGLTSKLPRWDHRLRFQAGTLVTFDVNPSDDDVTYRIFMNPSVDKNPTLESDTPLLNSDWQAIEWVVDKTTIVP